MAIARFASAAVMRAVSRSVGAPLAAAASRALDSFAGAVAARRSGFPPSLALEGAGGGGGAPGGLQRRAVCGVDDLEGTADDEESDTLRGSGGLRELVTGRSALPGLGRPTDGAAAGGWWGADDSDSSSSAGWLTGGDGADGDEPLSRRLALSVESLRALLADGTWFAVPKRKASYRKKRLRQMNPANQEVDKQNFYPCPKCDKGLLKLRHHLCPCDQEKVHARAVVKIRYTLARAPVTAAAAPAKADAAGSS